MRLFRTTLLVIAFVSALIATAQNPPANDVKLPVRRVVLYKNGVGYFEHTGRVNGAQPVTISFTTAQLNDVLKSLTVLDSGEGRITGVSYNSTAPLDQRLRTSLWPAAENTTEARFLAVLRGARIEVRSGTSVASGRLLSVETRETKHKDGSTTKVDALSLVTDRGELRTFDLTPATSVRLLERGLNEDVGRYLNIISSAREQDVRRMVISTSGTGTREMLVSYISEVPVWKSTYRIVLPKRPGAKPLLQGWAVVDNTVGEDWNNVELSLVAGAPQSFIQALSTPYYTRRPVVPLPESAMMTPQTHEGAIQTATTNAALASAPAPTPKPALAKAAPAGGIGSRSAAEVKDRISFFTAPEASEELLAKQQAAAETHDLGDLFEYRLKQPVTIRKDQSALVPIAQTPVEIEKVTLWPAAARSASRPLRTLWLTNSSGLTLDAGSFNVLENGMFAGEGLMEPMQPGEKRLLSYAVDLGVRVKSESASQGRRVTRLSVSRGMLVQTTEVQERHTYTVRNEDTETRSVIVEHPARADVKLSADSPKPEETTAAFHRFRLSVEPKSTRILTITESQPISATYALTNLTFDQIGVFVQQRTIDPNTEKTLRGIVAQKDAVAALDSQIAASEKETASIFADQQRVRENLKALKGSPDERDLVQRYTRQLNQQEDRLQALSEQTNALRKAREKAQTELNRSIQDLSMEAAL
jgi:hypothetical protein